MTNIFNIIDNSIRTAVETGIYDKWLTNAQKWKKSYNPLFNEKKKLKLSSNAISFESLYGVFSLWALGLCVSAFVFFIECLREIIKRLLNYV